VPRGWVLVYRHVVSVVVVVLDVARKHSFGISSAILLSKQKLDTFVKDIIDGKLKPTIKSEPIPETQQGPVIVIVANSYDDLVISNEKDVHVEDYTQWCGPCKAFAPTYEKLAELYASNPISRDRVTVAKIDAEANDVPDDIRGLATFKLLPAGSKESPVLYTDSYTLEDMANFVRDNGKHRIDVHAKSNMITPYPIRSSLLYTERLKELFLNSGCLCQCFLLL
jgi:protein disulfide-isomerase A1